MQDSWGEILSFYEPANTVGKNKAGHTTLY